MSKGIIVIDAPEKCEDCSCCHTDNYNFYCKQNGNHVDWEARPDWCPIKPLPEHKKVDPFPEDRGLLSEMEVVNIGKQIGWNECLDGMERSHKK